MRENLKELEEAEIEMELIREEAAYKGASTAQIEEAVSCLAISSAMLIFLHSVATFIN